MANKSEKKNEQIKQKQNQYFQTVLLIVTIFYLLNYLLRGELFETSTLLCFGFFSLINFFCYNSIAKNLSLGLDSTSYEYQLDVMIVNTGVQFGTCFWSGFWYIYLIVPGYILWKLSSFCFSRLSNTEEPEEIDESKLSNSQRKKREREREGKEKVVYKKVK